MFKKCTAVLMIITMIFTFTGCITQFRGAITLTENISVVGIDEEDDQVKITIILKLVKPVAEEESGKKQEISIYTSYGETIFDAVRNFHAYTDKDIYWGHIDYILIGQDTAKKGINKYLDMLVRDHETKLNAKVVITQGATASEFIKNTDVKQSVLNDILQSLFNDIDALSQSNPVSVIDYMRMMNSKGFELYLPCVQMVNYREKSKDEKDKKDVQLNGYAIFNDDKLIGIVNDKMARGVNWLINKIESAIIIAKDPKGHKLSLEIINAESKIEPDFSEDIPSAKVKIQFTTNIGEYQGADDIFHDDIIEYIVKEQNNIIKKEVENIIDYLQKKKCDIAGFFNRIYHKYPVKSKKIEQNWEDIFQEMDISVEVTSRINRIYNIKQPVAHKGEE